MGQVMLEVTYGIVRWIVLHGDEKLWL
jgi:hypothetical protein